MKNDNNWIKLWGLTGEKKITCCYYDVFLAKIDLAVKLLLWFAAELAQCFSGIRQLAEEIRQEGIVVKYKLNPKCRMKEKLIRQSIALSRLLQASTGPSRHPAAPPSKE